MRIKPILLVGLVLGAAWCGDIEQAGSPGGPDQAYSPLAASEQGSLPGSNEHCAVDASAVRSELEQNLGAGAVGLGQPSPGIGQLARETQAGQVHGSLWPSIAALEKGRGVRALGAALIEAEPGLELRCSYLNHFDEGVVRTSEELADLVMEVAGRGRGHGIDRTALIAAMEQAGSSLGQQQAAAGARMELESPVLQLVATYTALGQLGPSARAWFQGPQGQPRFDLLVALLGRTPVAHGLMGPQGGQLLDTAGHPVLLLGMGALNATHAIVVHRGVMAPPPNWAETSVGDSYELLPHGLVFNGPVTLSTIYDPGWHAQYLPGDVDSFISTYDEATGRWVALPSSEAPGGTVSAELSHFSFYQLMALYPKDLVISSAYQTANCAVAADAVSTANYDGTLWVDGVTGDVMWTEQHAIATYTNAFFNPGASYRVTAVELLGESPSDGILWAGVYDHADGKPNGSVWHMLPGVEHRVVASGTNLGWIRDISADASSPPDIYMATVVPVDSLVHTFAHKAAVQKVSFNGGPVEVVVGGAVTAAGCDQNDRLNPRWAADTQMNLPSALDASSIGDGVHPEFLFIADSGNNWVRVFNAGSSVTYVNASGDMSYSLPGSYVTTIMGDAGCPSSLGALADLSDCGLSDRKDLGQLANNVRLHFPLGVAQGAIIGGLTHRELMVSDTCKDTVRVMDLTAVQDYNTEQYTSCTVFGCFTRTHA